VTTLRGFGRAWDRLTIYLPVLLMGLLALGTWWLARNAPTVSRTAGEAPVRHEPDYFLRGFSVKSFDPEGHLTSDLRGTEARHYPDTDTLEVDAPRIRRYDARGSLTTATAKRAISNADGSQVQLIGDAVVRREGKDAQGQPLPRMEIRGDFLHFFTDRERVLANKPVTLLRGNDVFQADGLEYDNLDRVLQLRGNVRGTLHPRAQARP
jgi:lipopolysaccharide export system protein LptC